jgi:hypothetical protein
VEDFMTRKEVNHLIKVLERIKDPDVHIHHALVICNKQLALYDKTKGQLKEQYETEHWWN